MARRLVLTAGAFLERRPATYEVAERRQLAALAALVRCRAWQGLGFSCMHAFPCKQSEAGAQPLGCRGQLVF